MPLRNILVAYNGSASAGEAVRHALRLAEAHGAHVTGVLSHGVGQVAASLGPWATPELLAIITENEARACEAIAAQFHEIVRETAPDAADGGFTTAGRVHWRDVSGGPDGALIDMALAFDVVVMGQDSAEGAERHHTAHPDTVALRSGRPVLVVPRGYAPLALVPRAVLAWDGRRAAARALSDAMPLIGGFTHVTVLTVDLGEEGRASAQAVVTHLARHGLMTEHLDVPSDGGIARTILAACARQEAGLLVMGAYEHSKLAEDLFGGTTNRILREARLPVLMAH